MTDNVVHFPVPRVTREELLARRLRNTKRLNHADPPVLARNLGRLAQQLNPQRPVEGAKQMFRHVWRDDWEREWRKRQRVLRLPDEPAPDFADPGDYTSAGNKYVLLAEAYSHLSQVDKSLGSAFRKLTAGTTLNPRSQNVPSSDEGLDAAKELLGKVQEAARQAGTVSNAFSILSRYPIHPDDGGFTFVASSSPAVSYYGLEQNGSRILPWFIPRIRIGYIYHILDSSCLYLGTMASFDAGISGKEWKKARRIAVKGTLSDGEHEQLLLRTARELHLGPSLVARLEKYGFDESQWNGNDVLRWEDALGAKPNVSIKYAIEVGLWPSIERELELRLHVLSENYEHDAAFPTFVIRYGEKETELHVIADIPKFAELIEKDGDLFATCDFEYIAEAYNELDFDAGAFPLESPDCDRLLMGDHDAEVWDDPSKFALAPQLSRAATIIRNLTYGVGLDRIDEALLADAETRLGPLIAYYEDERRKLEEASGL